MAATVPKQGGNRLEWPTQTARLGKVANARVGCSWPTSARWAGRWWTSGCHLPKSWTSDQVTGVLRRVCRRTGGTTGPELALELLERVLELGHLRAEWVPPETTPSGCRRPSPGTGGPGDALRAGRSGRHYNVWPLEPAWTSPEYPAFGRPRKPRLRSGPADHGAASVMQLPDEAWREITVAQGSQGPAPTGSCPRVRASRRRKPGEELWAV